MDRTFSNIAVGAIFDSLTVLFSHQNLSPAPSIPYSTPSPTICKPTDPHHTILTQTLETPPVLSPPSKNPQPSPPEFYPSPTLNPCPSEGPSITATRDKVLVSVCQDL